MTYYGGIPTKAEPKEMRAITGTHEEILSVYFSLKIQRDQWGCEMFEIIVINDNLETLVWVPAVKKERKQPSMKAMNDRAYIYDLHVQPCDGGFEIVSNHGKNERIAFSKTKFGIQRILTNRIDAKIRASVQRSMDLANFTY
jgi:hypothetical protein